jgi:hypothetical protein
MKPTFVNQDVFTLLKVSVAAHPKVRVLEYFGICHSAGPSNFKGCESLFVITGCLNIGLENKDIKKGPV